MKKIIFINWRWKDLENNYVKKEVSKSELLIFSNYEKAFDGISKFKKLISSFKQNDYYFLIFTHINENSNNISKSDLKDLKDNRTQIVEFKGGAERPHPVYFYEKKKIGFINDTDRYLSNTWQQLEENIIKNFQSIWSKYWREIQ
jgi:hypothetical protein